MGVRGKEREGVYSVKLVEYKRTQPLQAEVSVCPLRPSVRLSHTSVFYQKKRYDCFTDGKNGDSITLQMSDSFRNSKVVTAS